MILVTGTTGLSGFLIICDFSRQHVSVRALVRNHAEVRAFEALSHCRGGRREDEAREDGYPGKISVFSMRTAMFSGVTNGPFTEYPSFHAFPIQSLENALSTFKQQTRDKPAQQAQTIPKRLLECT